MTEPAPITAMPLHVGAVVSITQTSDDEPRLGLIAQVPDNVDAALEAIQFLPGAIEPGWTRVWRNQLAAPPDVLTAAQWAQVRRLLDTLGLFVIGRQRQLELDLDAALAKIESMRSYAIRAHKADPRQICREGLNEFLQTHDLPPFEARRTAHVTLELDVQVDGAADATSAAAQIRDAVQTISNDEEQVQITSEEAPQVHDIRWADEED